MCTAVHNITSVLLGVKEYAYETDKVYQGYCERLQQQKKICGDAVLTGRRFILVVFGGGANSTKAL